ncbi:TMV resistance protein N-like [Senna tora]|uniref:TMV resistance protein N-like n=1 Tax=Senna tora TaxID=362788 RepID=A0A834T2E1_9FABA|nr:TMV resistance protein N-like [Senna tora]
MGQQFKLEELYMNNCRSLKNVQSNLFNGLQSLKELQLNDCCNIFEVIDHINITLSSLNSLSIEGITVESLPSSIKQFSNLQYLKLNKCTRLQSLPQLPQSLITLDAIGCSTLKRIITNKSVDEAEAEAIIADDNDSTNLIKTFYFRKNANNFTSNHVFLWSSRKHLEVIKECGVCPTNYFKFQNFIHELEVESEASASGMGVGSSYHQCKDEEEAIAPIHKSKGFIFSPFPTTSSKNGTQGFKDIFNL